MGHYYPAPVNQFNRLVRVSGSVATGSYVASEPWDNMHRNPRTGRVEDYDGRNCTAAIGALLRDAHTGGRSRSTPPTIRNAQSDWDGGIGWDDVNDAWQTLWGERLLTPRGYDWADVLARLREGRVVGIGGDHDAVPYEFQCQKGGTFDHAFALGDYRPSDGEVLRYDSLCKTGRWVPQRAIRGAAEKLAIAQRGNRADLFLIMTRIVPPPYTPSWRVSIKPTKGQPRRRFFRYLLTGTFIVGRTDHRTGGFSAGSTAPVMRRVHSDHRDEFPKDEYRLVRITDPRSVYNGWWVDAGYSEEV
jgi:hypothetical protein